MNPGEFADKMRAIYAKSPTNHGISHEEADALIVELLKEIGYGEGAQIFEEATRWFE